MARNTGSRVHVGTVTVCCYNAPQEIPRCGYLDFFSYSQAVLSEILPQSVQDGNWVLTNLQPRAEPQLLFKNTDLCSKRKKAMLGSQPSAFLNPSLPPWGLDRVSELPQSLRQLGLTLAST